MRPGFIMGWVGTTWCNSQVAFLLNSPSRGLRVVPEWPQIPLMLKQKYLLVAILCFGVAYGLGVGVSRAEGVPLAVANIQSLSVAVSPLILRAAQGEHNTLVVSIDSTGLTNARSEERRVGKEGRSR